MKFGDFDDDRKEYVITHPNTPQPWCNYLGSLEYGAIITNNAGGYSFYKSGGKGRFMRMHFNSVLKGQPGRYIYLRDRENADFWSGSWLPVAKPLETFKSECRHGMSYTKITSEYRHIRSELVYFVPLNKNFEIWKVKISNLDSIVRKLSAFTYVEYAGNWHAMDDLLNLQYTHYTTLMKVYDGIIDHGTNVNIPHMPGQFDEKDQGRHTFQTLVGTPVISWDTDRESFIGKYRTYANPIAVETGRCSNSLAYGDNACGSLHTDFELRPDETVEFLVIVGIGRADEKGRRVADEFNDIKKADIELQKLIKFWHDRIEGIFAKTPDAQLNSTINIWGIYNCLVTFSWSRSASLVYTGVDRDGLAYRDTVQDFLGVVHAIPDDVKKRLELMITGQVSNGGAIPVISPTQYKPGREAPPAEDEYRSDDTMWLFQSIPEYVKETGDIGFFEKVLPYADKDEDTVFMHMKSAIQFSLERRGKHGLPLGLKADWNDCLRFGSKGESVFVAMQLRYALSVYVEIAGLLRKEDEEKWGASVLKELDNAIQKYTWDGEWFLRGFGSDSMKYGSRENEEGQIFLNPQSWAVISGVASEEQAEMAMNKVNEKLATRYGLMICDPPFTKANHGIVRAQLMNPGLKENGGVFMHTQGWAVIAEAMLGHGNRAYEYLKSYLPAAYNTRAEIREIEPYVLCQSTHSKYSPNEGRSRISWLTGSATLTYYAITHYILGIRPEYDGLVIDPCIPSDWDGFTVNRKFRAKTFEITVDNDHSVQKGVQKLIINGEELEDNFIPVDIMRPNNKVLVIMG